MEGAGEAACTVGSPRTTHSSCGQQPPVPFPQGQDSLKVDFKQIFLFLTSGTVYFFRQRFCNTVTDRWAVGDRGVTTCQGLGGALLSCLALSLPQERGPWPRTPLASDTMGLATGTLSVGHMGNWRCWDGGRDPAPFTWDAWVCSCPSWGGGHVRTPTLPRLSS